MGSEYFSAEARISGEEGAFPMTGLIQDIIGGRSSELAKEDHFRIVASCSRFEPRSFVFGSCFATRYFR